MQQEPAQKFVGRDRHLALLVAVSIIFPPKGDLAICQGDQSVVGNGHAVRVPGQILEYVFWSAKRRLSINDPILPEQLPQKGVKRFGFAQMFEPAVEAE